MTISYGCSSFAILTNLLHINIHLLIAIYLYTNIIPTTLSFNVLNLTSNKSANSKFEMIWFNIALQYCYNAVIYQVQLQIGLFVTTFSALLISALRCLWSSVTFSAYVFDVMFTVMFIVCPTVHMSICPTVCLRRDSLAFFNGRRWRSVKKREGS